MIVDENRSYSILANEIQIDQIVQNLLSNSRHAIFSRGGFGRITVKLDTDAESEQVQLVVEDDGVGIPPEKTSRDRKLVLHTTKGSLGGDVFDSKYTGTGIGLSTCRRISSTIS